MKSVGIICEYNPFHNGHLYHLNKVKQLFPDHVIILVFLTDYFPTISERTFEFVLRIHSSDGNFQ